MHILHDNCLEQCYHNMNVQVAYFDFLMNQQQRLVFAQSAVYVTSIFFLLSTCGSSSTSLIVYSFPSPAINMMQ